MQITVDLNAIVEAMEAQDEGQKTFLNTRTGELVLYSHEEFSSPEFEDDDDDYEDDDEDALPSWQRETYDLEDDILGSDDYLALPDLDESDKYHLMEQFCYALTESEAKDKLLDVIQDDGEYEHFVTSLEENGMAEEWMQYRAKAYWDIAKDWCDKNDLVTE